MGQNRPNSGSVWETKSFDDDNARCHFSGDCLIDGSEFKLFGRREEGERVIDFTENAQTMATCRMKPIPDRQSDRSPHYRGVLHILGCGWNVAGWAKVIKTRNGDKRMLSLSFQQMQPEGGQDATDTTSVDEDAPF